MSETNKLIVSNDFQQKNSFLSIDIYASDYRYILYDFLDIGRKSDLRHTRDKIRISEPMQLMHAMTRWAENRER
jgi:hypothetical protein